MTPAQIVGAVSLAALVIAFIALYGYGLSGRASPVYVATSVLALYLNAFVAVVQAFQKLPALQALAPTQTELPFAIAQVILLVVMVILGWRALHRFHPPGPMITA